jgi:O-antigen ligase
MSTYPGPGPTPIGGPRGYRLPAPGDVGPARADVEQDTGWRSLSRLWKDVDWSISYAAFLLYLVIVITYRFSGASVVIGGGAACLLLEKKGFRIPGWLIWFAAFLLWGVVVYTKSPYRAVAWDQGVVEYAKLWLICLVAANTLTTWPRVRFFLIFFLFLYVSHPVRGVLFNMFIYGSAEQGRSAWNGMWSNPNDAAALTFFPLGVAAGLLRDRHELVRKGALASVAVMPFMILLTQSRGAFLALGIFASMTILANLKQVRALVLIAVVAVGAVLLAPEGTFERFGNFTSAVRGGDLAQSEDQGSAEQRLAIWRIARSVINDSPIFGVGLAAYPNAHGRKSLLSASRGTAGGMRDTHSTYLRVIAEAGYPGFVLFIVPFIVAIVAADVTRRKYAKRYPDRSTNLKYIEAGLVAYFVAGIFGSYAHTIFIWLHLGTLTLLTEELRRTAAADARAARNVQARGPDPRPSRLAHAGS